MLDSAFTPLVLPRVGEDRVDLRDETARARARGYADGFAEGRKAADAEAAERRHADEQQAAHHAAAAGRALASVLDALGAARLRLDDRTADLAEIAADRVERLALDLAETILAAELSDDARSAAHALRRALAAAPDAEPRELLLNPDDHAVLRNAGGLAALPDGVVVVPSPDVDRGGAIVHLDDGAVDARLAPALTRVTAALNPTSGGEPA